jgi:WXG100 family type VII secretion target
MSDGQLGYNFEGISNLRTGISGVNNEMTAILDGIVAEVKPLAESWQGEAAGAYLDCQRRWDQAIDGLNQVLAEVGIVVGRGGENMQMVNHAIGRSFPGR